MTTGRKYVGALVAFVAATTFGAVMVGLPGSASAGVLPLNLVVDTLEDDFAFDATDGECDEGPDGACSLREAVALGEYGNGANITFSVDGVFKLGLEIVIEEDVPINIMGNGVDATILDVEPSVQPFRGRNGGELRHFYIERTELTLDGMTLRDGRAGGGGSVFVAYQGALATNDVHFLDNTARGDGGAIFANAENDTVDIADTTFAGNNASGGGGAIWVSHDTVTVVNSTFTDNSARDGAAIGVHYHGTLTVDWSTFSGNTTAVEASQAQSFRSMRSTAAAPQGRPSDASTIYSEPTKGDGAVVTISHSILEKTTGATTDECGGIPMTSGGANIVDDDSCGFVSALDVEGVAANVGPLQNNGGPTFTMALVAASAAVDVDPAACDLDDQRGLPRNVDGDEDGTAACDSGAYELQVAPDEPTTTTTTTTTAPDGDVDANTATPATPTVAKPTFTG